MLLLKTPEATTTERKLELTTNGDRLYLEPGADDMATLRSPEHTYNIRQKNTSNGMFLIKPCAPDAASAQQGVAAIATIKETVELERINKMIIMDRNPNTKNVGKWHEKFGRSR